MCNTTFQITHGSEIPLVQITAFGTTYQATNEGNETKHVCFNVAVEKQFCQLHKPHANVMLRESFFFLTTKQSV
jgi:hypothetical protein